MQLGITGPFESSRRPFRVLPSQDLESRGMHHLTGPGKEILTFLILTFALRSVTYYLIIAAGSLGACGFWRRRQALPVPDSETKVA